MHHRRQPQKAPQLRLRECLEVGGIPACDLAPALRDRLSTIALRRLKAKCPTKAVFGSRRRRRGTQCNLLSMPQWPYTAYAACLADNAAELDAYDAPAAGDRDQVIGAASQFLANIVDQKILLQPFPGRLRASRGRRLRWRQNGRRCSLILASPLPRAGPDRLHLARVLRRFNV